VSIKDVYNDIIQEIVELLVCHDKEALG